MENDMESIVRKNLEDVFDIPFDVTKTLHYQDACYSIKPHNSNKELFEINLKIINHLRLVIEVVPEKFAAFSIKDMSQASVEKKQIFTEYANQLILKKAKVDFFINDIHYDAIKAEEWPSDWKSYYFRITRSPICSEDEDFNETEVVSDWTNIVVGMFLSLLNVIIVEQNEGLHYEGGIKKVLTNRYERDPINRELCLAANGYTCKICGMNFEKVYGKIGHNFIHVHHIVPISKMDEAYLINPIEDLIPVCPNCHAMLHKQDPPLNPTELKSMIKKT